MKLNWGCAHDIYEGWVGSDLEDYGQEHVGDILDGLPWPDNTFDVVVTHHALQIIKYIDLPFVIGEFYRVLKPTGILRGSVPDIIGAFNAWDRGDESWFPIEDVRRVSMDGKLSAYLTWYSEARSAFTPRYLLELLSEDFSASGICGYDMTLLGPEIATQLDKRPNESIFFEAVK